MPLLLIIPPSVPIYMRHFSPDSLDYKGGKEKWNERERFNSSRKQQKQISGQSLILKYLKKQYAVSLRRRISSVS
jgi:hypothetical protein